MLNSDDFSESITYTPTGSSPQTIKAVIDRKSTDPNGPDQHYQLIRGAEIRISTDATSGVSTVTPKKDVVSFPVHLGGTAVDWNVVEILQKDDGVWQLRVTLK